MTRSRSRLAAVMVVIAPSVRRPDVTHVVAAPPRIPGIDIPEWLIWTLSVCDVEVIREGAGRRDRGDVLTVPELRASPVAAAAPTAAGAGSAAPGAGRRTARAVRHAVVATSLTGGPDG